MCGYVPPGETTARDRQPEDKRLHGHRQCLLFAVRRSVYGRNPQVSRQGDCAPDNAGIEYFPAKIRRQTLEKVLRTLRQHPNLNIIMPRVTPCPTGPTKKVISGCKNILLRKRGLSCHPPNFTRRRRLSRNRPPRLHTMHGRCRTRLNFPKRQVRARGSSLLCSPCSPALRPRAEVCFFFRWSRPENCCRQDKTPRGAEPGSRQHPPSRPPLPSCLLQRRRRRLPPRNPPLPPPPRFCPHPPLRPLRFRPPPRSRPARQPRRPPPLMQRPGNLPSPAQSMPEKARPPAPSHSLRTKTVTSRRPAPLSLSPLLPPLPNPLRSLFPALRPLPVRARLWERPPSGLPAKLPPGPPSGAAAGHRSPREVLPPAPVRSRTHL
jgi:hypothetical protein